MINYYKILGISKSASEEEIKEAYRKKALRYHPDVNDSPKAHSMFQDINEAYTELRDPISREKYDLVLEYGFEGIAAAIKKEKAPKHKDPAYAPKSEEFMRGYQERKSKQLKKTRQTMMIENVLFASMVCIGFAAFSFACIDMMAEEWAERMPGLSGLIFSISFLILLGVGWKLVLGRKFWM